jgi:hypothetical protein
VLTAYEAGEAPGHGGLEAGFDGAQPEELVGELGLLLALDLELAEGLEEEERLGQVMGVMRDQDGAGGGEGLEAGG